MIRGRNIENNQVFSRHIPAENILYTHYNIVETIAATEAGVQVGANTTHVIVTSANANNIVILPEPVVGKQLTMDVDATGFKLRSSAPATVAINSKAEANAESAIAANSTLFLICVSATAWKGFFLDADSDVAKIPAAAAI